MDPFLSTFILLTQFPDGLLQVVFSLLHISPDGDGGGPGGGAGTLSHHMKSGDYHKLLWFVIVSLQ